MTTFVMIFLFIVAAVIWALMVSGVADTIQLFCARTTEMRQEQRRLFAKLFWRLYKMEGRIVATQEEVVQQLNAAKAQAEKIGGETRTLLTRIEDLLAQLANAANVTPELQAAADAVTEQLAVVDDLVPDAPAPEVAPPLEP